MAGHSQFKNIMHRKGAQDAKRGRMFARLIREITVSARQGLPDPAANPRLRAAAMAARRRGLAAASGRPWRAETVISRMRRANMRPRLASCAPLRCMIFLNCEWPAMEWSLD